MPVVCKYVETDRQTQTQTDTQTTRTVTLAAHVRRELIICHSYVLPCDSRFSCIYKGGGLYSSLSGLNLSADRTTHLFTYFSSCCIYSYINEAGTEINMSTQKCNITCTGNLITTWV